MNNIQLWDFEGDIVRTVEIDGVTWWSIKDICQVLGIINNRDIKNRLEDDEVGRFNIPHPQNPEKTIEMTFVNEFGLYEFLFRSDKPKARPFRKWVTHEVLPTIRKTGRYVVNEESETEESAAEMSKAYAYLDMAKIVSRCKTERLPLVLDLLREGGWNIPEQDGSGENEIQVIDTAVLSEKIKRVMSKHNLTLTALSMYLRQHLRTMSRYLRQESFPKPVTYNKLVRQLDELYAMDKIVL